MAYKYNPEMAGNSSSGDWPVLAEGDYPFSVTACSFPIENENGYDVCRIELSVAGQRIWDNRSAGAGPKGEFDMISPFLAAINRIPKKGEENSPTFWGSLCGAKGKVHLVQDEYKGKTRNKVAWYHAPKEIGPGAEQRPRQSYSQAEVEKAAQDARRRAGGPIGPDLGIEPEDIPFACDYL